MVVGHESGQHEGVSAHLLDGSKVALTSMRALFGVGLWGLGTPAEQVRAGGLGPHRPRVVGVSHAKARLS